VGINKWKKIKDKCMYVIEKMNDIKPVKSYSDIMHGRNQKCAGYAVIYPQIKKSPLHMTL